MASKLIAIALCISSLISLSNAGSNINGYITGKVTCDPCVNGGTPIKYAQIMVICFDKSNAGTYARKAITNPQGVYNVAMKPGIEKERCDIRLHKNSPLKTCSVFMPGKNVTTVNFSKTVGQWNGKPLYSAVGVVSYKKPGSKCK